MIGNLIKPRKAAKGKPATDVLFALDHGGPSRPADHDWMGKLLFTCRVTGIRVQHWLDDDDPTRPGDYYQSIVCPACARLHFVNRKTGRLLGCRVSLDEPPQVVSYPLALTNAFA